MMMHRRKCFSITVSIALVLAFHKNYVASSSFSSSSSPSVHSSQLPKSLSSSTVTFLYELYEHELYNPTTDSWTSRRFTQSPLAGGGGRDSTSMDPQTCAPPRNYLFQGEWKIDMSGNSKDAFGWEYYVGRYDGLGRRRRRWVRNLSRVAGTLKYSTDYRHNPKYQSHANVTSDNKDNDSLQTKEIYPTLLTFLQRQYRFKGFGWTLNKPLFRYRAFGASFRIPLSTNFLFCDRCSALPFISSSTYFGYPWVIATFLNASLPVEVCKWVVGGILWKIGWGVAVVSAILRAIVELSLWILTAPWRISRLCTQLVSFVFKKCCLKSDMAQSLMESYLKDNANPERNETQDHASVDLHLQISDSQISKKVHDLSLVSGTVVRESPPGRRTTFFSKRYLTLLGYEVPPFHRTTSLECTSIVPQRIGVCISWRLSKERGYEQRWNFFYSCLPPLHLWGQWEEEAKKKWSMFFHSLSGKTYQNSVKASSDSPLVSSFLQSYSASLGVSGAFPLPMEPYFTSSFLLSLNGFYYGWLWKYIASALRLNVRDVLEDNRAILPPVTDHSGLDDEDTMTESSLSEGEEENASIESMGVVQGKLKRQDREQVKKEVVN